MSRKRVDINDPMISPQARNLVRAILWLMTQKFLQDGLTGQPQEIAISLMELWETGFVQIEFDGKNYSWSLLDDATATQLDGPCVRTLQ